jgi:hypothetical protein
MEEDLLTPTGLSSHDVSSSQLLSHMHAYFQSLCGILRQFSCCGRGERFWGRKRREKRGGKVIG